MFLIENLKVFSENRAIIWHENNKICEKFTYSDVINASILIKQILIEIVNGEIDNKQNSSIENIAIVIGQSPVIIPIIIGILNAKFSFCCIDPNQSEQQIELVADKFNANILIVINDHPIGTFVGTKEVIIFSRKIYFLKRISESKNGLVQNTLLKSSDIMFKAKTSGSTGEPKVVGVTYNCFMSNIECLNRYYALKSSDVIYITSPPTFDPFILDVFLAISSGAAITLASDNLRLSSNALLKHLFCILPTCIDSFCSVTIIQITPSLFLRWSLEDIKDIIFAPQTSLRCLTFGGEPFPCISDVAKWLDWSGMPKTKLFNIYGCTEMSCWSTVYEVKQTDILTNSDIPIGMPIDKMSRITINDVLTHEELVGSEVSGQLCLHSDVRKCYLNNTLVQTVFTGDLVERRDNQIYYKSRLGDSVKRYGIKVNLSRIEQFSRSFMNILNSKCVLDKTTNELILFIVNTESGNNYVEKQLRIYLGNHLLPQEMPDVICAVDQIPLSSHGKISNSKLLEMYRKQRLGDNLSPVHFFIKNLNESLDTNISVVDTKVWCTQDHKKSRGNMLVSFKQIGGTSFIAMHLISKIERKFGQNFPQLMTLLLNDEIQIREVIEYLADVTESDMAKATKEANDEAGKLQLSIKLIPKWEINMDKCVDASPTIFSCDMNSVLSIGSHSHRIINVRITDGSIQSELRLPDRVESQVTQYKKNYGFVGCYDGFLYCFDIIDGSIKWQFNSSGMIKCRPIPDANDHVIFGNYCQHHNLWCVDGQTGNFIWSTKIGTKSICANPCLLSDAETILVGTLDGTLARCNISTGNCIWKKTMSSPIFSHPQQLLDWDLCLVAEVSGAVHCIDFNGNILSTYKSEGNIFSSFELLREDLTGCVTNSVIFGCYNKSVYCLTVSFDGQNCEFHLAWQCLVNGQVFATPKLLNSNILVCSTNGTITTIRDGQVHRQWQINGECFSTPAIGELGQVFVGCRNNYVYCFELND